jgi:hypothetical protein
MVARSRDFSKWPALYPHAPHRLIGKAHRHETPNLQSHLRFASFAKRRRIST